MSKPNLYVAKTSFNKEALKAMSYAKFEKLYKGKFIGDPDLKKVFTDNGGKIK